MKDIFAKNHERYLGCNGSRKLMLRIMSKGILQEQLSFLQTWMRTDNGIESLITIEPGSPFAGTRVRIFEKLNSIDLDVEIDIPGSKRLFSIHSPFENFVFSSEFTYEDFRFFIPPGIIAIEPNVFLDNRCSFVVNYSKVYARHVIDTSLAIPVETEWYNHTDSRPFRVVLSKDFSTISNVVMPSIMTAQQVGINESEQSCMILGDVKIVA